MADISNIDWSVISGIIPPEVFVWGKITLIVIAIYFISLIIRNILQTTAVFQMRKILKNVQQINMKLDQLFVPQDIQQYDQSYYEEQQN